MKILSWNILANEFIKKRYYPMIPPAILLNRKQREKQIITILKEMDTDIMLLQEVMQGEVNALTFFFQKTHYILRGKNIKWQQHPSHSGNVTLIRKSLLTALPLSIPLAFGLGVECMYRNQPLLIYNIHLDDISHSTRMKQLNELVPNLTAYAQVILGGDFNENYTKPTRSELYQQLKQTGLKIVNHKSTYYVERKMCIDQLMVKGLQLKHLSAHVLDDFKGDVTKQFITYGSDHLPVIIN